jgi:hypothetical protein
MTPQEKARKLTDRFYNEIKYMERAKVCALIAVDEAVHYLEIVLGVDKSDFEYWQEVKKEIEKL